VTTFPRCALIVGLILLLLDATVRSAPAPVAMPASALGPPLLCHPFDIGDAASLPFGKGAFDAEPGLSRKEVVDRTLTVLSGTRDATVHMETMRRAVIHLAGGEDDRGTTQVDPLLLELERRHDRAVRLHASDPHDEAARTDLALTALDLAYAAGALSEFGLHVRNRETIAALATVATTALPDDGAVQLGGALLALSLGDQARMYAHLDRALLAVKAAPKGSSLLAHNIGATIGNNLGVRDTDAMAAKVARELERS
jgi:hypothetical protein